MPNINSCNIAGHAAADAELRTTPSGTKVCEIRMAVNAGWGDNKKTVWTKIVIWGKPAEWMAGCQKGDTVVTNNAEFSVDEWTNKDNEKRRTHYFTAGNGSTTFYVKKGHFKAQQNARGSENIYSAEKDAEKEPDKDWKASGPAQPQMMDDQDNQLPF